MALSLYEVTIPGMLRGFTILDHYLAKATAHAEARGFSPDNGVSMHLAPDMLPFAGQIQRASDNAKGGISRITGLAAPSMDDDEATLSELSERIAKTVSFLNTITPDQVNGREDKTIDLRFKSITTSMSAQEYVLRWLMPNFYFHVTTAHDILRHKGVDVGKRDYLGNFS